MEMVLFRNGIWDMLRKINESIDQVFRPLADAHHITMMQMRLLMELTFISPKKGKKLYTMWRNVWINASGLFYRKNIIRIFLRFMRASAF